MLSNVLVDKLNEQITYEFASAHIYLAMAAYCYAEDLDGFANFFIVQAEEERFHAMKFFNFVNDMGQRVRLGALSEPSNEYSSILDVFQKALAHEKTVTKRIYALSDIAIEEREHATISLLKWFIDEQVEEESTMNKIISKLERIKDDSNGIYLLDAELAARTFTPQATV